MPEQSLFLSIMMIGVMVTISSSSWFTSWMGLEMNTLAFIPMMADQSNKMTNEAMLKYFLTHTLASTMLLIPTMTTTSMMSTWMNPPNTIIFIALAMKMGAAPQHFWLPQVMEGLSWQLNMVLATIQKINPIFMMTLTKSSMNSSAAILSLLSGAIGGYNQTSLRKLMAYSSISHMGGMMMAMMKSTSLVLVYITIYITISVSTMMVFLKTKMSTTTQTPQLTTMLMILMMLNMLSLGGLPPFLGFVPKWMLIKQFTETNMLMTLILISTSIVTLFFYLRITYNKFLMSSLTEPKKFKMTKTPTIITIMALLTLPLPMFMM
uniref:NADH-ubiquinone oxidoreductase chain 2 n=1 Tax=Strigamia maritima TaxID=126957 RepID=A0A0C5AR09_STRMM|nr:NADH dehydrogenase subunit 2 [Strigamia maritima]AJK90876.1 NADH dehydrogenase subunit 2 [Strigamia maritima]